MVKLGNTQDLGSCAERLVGSTPTVRTIKNSPAESGTVFYSAILFLLLDHYFSCFLSVNLGYL